MAPVLLLPLGMAPLAARALGLGELRVTSALGQPLQARIELIGTSAAEAELAKVGLASAEEHRRLGVDGSLAGVALRFAVKVGDNGRSYVSVTSYEPVREPYLDFVVEAISPSGQVARHYTVLLDPVGSAPPTPAASPAPAWSAPPAPAVPRPPRAFNPFANVGQPRAGATYGPVPPGITLWTVARRVRPAGADLDAVMAAIVRANPQAFINGDPTRLKAGVKLTIPEARELRQTPPVAAAAEAAPSPPPAAAESPPAPASTAAAGPIEAPAPAAEVRVLRGEDAKAPAPVSGATEVGGAPRVQLLEEALDAAQQQNEALQRRLGALEDQIKTLTELVKTSPGGEAGAATGQGAAGGVTAPPPTAPALPAAVAPAPAATAAPAGGVMPYLLAAAAGLGLGGLLLWRQRRRGRGELAAPAVGAPAAASGAATAAATPPTQVEWVQPTPAAPAPAAATSTAAAAAVVSATASAQPAATAAGASQPPADDGFGDPVDTQIDLLTAYVGMADGASARQVFAEIQRSGTPEQVAQAAAVLARLDA